LFGLAGFLSASFALSTHKLVAGFGLFYPGLVFGLALTAVLAVLDGVRSPLKGIAFLAASTAAFPFSIFTAFYATALLQQFGWTQNASFNSPRAFDVPLPAVFAAGAVGALVVLLAAFFLFGPSPAGGRNVAALVAAALAGGALGEVGWMVSSAEATTYRDPFDSIALYLLWQTGVALSLGAALPETLDEVSGPAPARRSTPIRIMGALLFAAILAFFGWQSYSQIQAYRSRAHADEARRKMVAEAPSVQNLPPIEPIEPEQALIVEDIGSFYAQPPRVENVFGALASSDFGPATPPFASYVLSFATSKQPSPYGSVVVTVDHYPNAAWAKYRSKYPNVNRFAMNSAGETVWEFANLIYVFPPPPVPEFGQIICHWPSGAFSVTLTIRMRSTGAEEVLQRYLKKYPSSL